MLAGVSIRWCYHHKEKVAGEQVAAGLLGQGKSKGRQAEFNAFVYNGHLPEAQHAVCTAILNEFLRRYE
ncbi:MAG TPA: hypothetical protein VET24_08085 [Actinomycetota bacterium]|nr:hypothetical protein [Actinomycetota bacterium]